MFRLTAALSCAVLVLAGCMADQPDPSDPMGRTPARLDAERAACVAEGGEFRPAGIGILTCIHTTTDGGTSCSKAGDCEGICMASEDGPGGTCSRTYPVFGCYAVYDAEGKRGPVLCSD